MKDIFIFGPWIVLGILCGVIGWLIGIQKDQEELGFILGFLFGPFGIGMILFTQGNRRNCPYCQELMHKTADVCPHCLRRVTTKYTVK